MSVLEICISGYTGADADASVDPAFRPLLNREIAGFDAMEAYVFKTATEQGEPDLFPAYYDTETGSLYTEPEPGVRYAVSVGYDMRNGWHALLPALHALLAAIYA